MPGQVEQRECSACDASADAYVAKDVALLVGDIPAAAQADAEGALYEDMAVLAHFGDAQVPQFGTDDE